MPTPTASQLFALALLGASQVNADAKLEQITVTAEKAPQNKLQASVSVSQLTSADINLIGAVHVNEVLARVPGTWVSRGNGQEHLTALRSPVLSGPGSCGEYLVAEDGIPTRPAGFCNVNQLFELNSEQAGAIEVLKGPGTVFYGSNALHGIINVISAKPENGGSVRIEAGPDDFSRSQLRWGQELGAQSFELRVSGSHDGGYKDDSGYDQQKLGFRHDYQGEQLSVKTLFSASNLNQETAGFVEGQNAYQDPAAKRSNPNPEAYRDASSWRLSSRWQWTLADGNQLVITPYLRSSDMEFIQHFLPGQALENNSQSSYGVQTQWHLALNEQLDWTLGLDLEAADMALREFQQGPTEHPSAFLVATIPAGLHYDYQVDSQMAAAYTHARWSLTEATRIDAGVRFESLEYDYDNRTTDGALKVDGSPCTLFGNVKTCRHARPEDGKDSFENLSYQLGFSHSVNADITVFGRVAKSFRAPQTSEMYRLQKGQLSANLDSESLASVELGLRYVADGLALELSAYDMDKEDYIFRDSDGFYIDSGESDHRGLELDVNYAINTQWKVALAASWARHRYSNNPDPALGDIDGNDVDTAPRRQANARLSWQPMPALQAELELVHLGEHYLDPQNEHEYKGHSLVNLRVAYQLDSWGFAARMTNVGDRDYAERADFAFGNYRYFVGQSRGIYLSADYNW